MPPRPSAAPTSDLGAARARFAESTRDLSDASWKLVAAIALEQTLGKSVLARLFGGAPSALDDFLASAVASGLFVPDRAAPAILFAAALADEPWFALHPDYEQLALRELAARRRLREVALELRDLMGARSVADIPLAIQDGDLDRFARAMAVRRLPRKSPPRTAATWLRVAVCEPFDAEWLARVFGADATRVAARVLAESLDVAAPCDALLAWARGRLEAARGRGADDGEARLALVVSTHAILRGEALAPSLFTSELPAETARGLEAAAWFVNGDAARAQTLLDTARAAHGGRRARREALGFGAVTPLLALLLAARDDAAARADAKRWLAEGATDAERAAARAFRRLLDYLAQPAGTERRLDAYALGPDAGTWETLLSAYTVHLHFDAPPLRASWAAVVADRALAWHAIGYAWLARQALTLARELDREHAARVLAERGADVSGWSRGGEASLWALLSPKPEWQKALEALATIGDASGERAEVALRVAWYVDVVHGTLSRPALQEYRANAGGWSSGRRVNLAELHEKRQALPPEDVRVLACTRETLDGKREFSPEAYEALVDHPRVLDGARGGAMVQVVRGQCRIETEDDGGYIRVLVEPAGAVLGVNVVPSGEERLVVYRVTPAMQRVMEVLPNGVRVPKSEEATLVRVLGKLAESVTVVSPTLGAERTVAADATPCVRVAPHAGAWLVELGVRPFGASGRFFVAGAGRVGVMHAEGSARLRAERDFDAERAGLAALLAECPTLSRDAEEQEEAVAAGEAHRFTLGEESVLALLAELRDAAAPHALEWPESPPMRLGGKVTSGNLGVRLRATKGWYLVTGGVRLNQVTEIALRELVRAPVLAGGRFVRLPGGDYVEIEERIRRVMAALRAAHAEKRAGGALRVHPGAVSVLSELAKPESDVDVDAAAKEWLARVDALRTKSFAVPDGLRAELRPYQLDGFVWLSRLAELGLGACLADDMGLGKTVQIIALLVARAASGPALVVAPTSVCTNWVRELARFAPGLVPVEYAGKNRLGALTALPPGAVVVTSYALLQQDEAALASIEWGTAVLDEAQFIKNPKSRRAEAAFRLNAAQRIAATGTPVENHFGDLFSIFRFLSPGLLGDWPEFNRTYIEPVERGGLAEPGAALRALVRPYVLRRKKSEVLAELPPLTEVQHDVRLSKDEATRYALLRRQIHEKLFTAHGKQQNKIQALAEITRLRRFCCHPRLVFPDADPDGSKVRVFLELASELRDNDRRALVFSQYVDFLSIVRESLDELGISYEYLDGSTPPAARQARVDQFQRGGATLFLISLKAGGFGLNLTGADTVVHLDPWWNPAVEAQATDRSHRIGQERPVTVYRLVTRDTIEEKIVELHGKKQRLARELLDGTDEPSLLDADTLLELIAGDGGFAAPA
ncbi:MAG TPA: DEAD/DEAH box helicase [Polyangiaceae bacterium]|nr:DEAD/DEAH box helicase [Polyangiaceae bacterium]